MGPIVVTVIRLIVPISVLRWPLGGFVAASVADALDVVIVGAIGSGYFEDYTSTDKLLDTYLLAFAAFVSLRWKNQIARYTSLALFSYRLLGVILLEVTNARWLLFVFPSVFDLFFLHHLTVTKWFPRFEVNGYRGLTIVLLLLLALKLPQEYVLHVLEFGPWLWFHTEVLGIE